jgi:ribonuclease HII
MPDLRLEKRHLAAGSGAVIGIDEAGRGPWAGPVTAAAFWINPNCFDGLPPELNDSKKLSPAKRASIYDALTGGEHAFCVVSIAAAEIDRIGILGATFLAMRQAATKLQALLISRRNAVIGLCLVDGNLDPDLGMPVKTVVKGDALSCSIAAASIIAKETRDNLMRDLARDHAVYGWDSNMGYGTKSHSDALHAHGVSEHHRRSFAPIKRLLQS